MLLEEVRAWLAAHGCAASWKTEAFNGELALLRPPPGVELELGSTSVGIVIPDCHLGWGNDVFRYNVATRERRLERFLDALGDLRDELHGSLCAVQVGDWYDFWRAPGIDAGAAKRLIEQQYAGIVSRARSLPLLHCIGNHDAALARPAIRDGLNVEIVRTIGSPGILCVHSHDNSTLERIAVDGTWESIGLNLLNIVNSAPLIGQLSSFLQKVVDESFEEPTSDEMASLAWKAASVAGPAGWSAPWIDRGGMTQFGQAIRGYELCVDHKVQLVLVGHSHRPGISWSPVTATRRVPVVDVGSWTYGRAEFAIVCRDGVGLARLTD